MFHDNRFLFFAVFGHGGGSVGWLVVVWPFSCFSSSLTFFSCSFGFGDGGFSISFDYRKMERKKSKKSKDRMWIEIVLENKSVTYIFISAPLIFIFCVSLFRNKKLQKKNNKELRYYETNFLIKSLLILRFRSFLIPFSKRKPKKKTNEDIDIHRCHQFPCSCISLNFYPRTSTWHFVPWIRNRFVDFLFFVREIMLFLVFLLSTI